MWALLESRVKDEMFVAQEQELNRARHPFAQLPGRFQPRRGWSWALEQGFRPRHHCLSGLYPCWMLRFDRYQRCRCTTLSGRTLPGVPRHSLFAELSATACSNYYYRIEAQRPRASRYAHRGPTVQEASGYAVFNWRAGYSPFRRHGRSSLLRASTNLGDP